MHRLVRLLAVDAVTRPVRDAVARWAYARQGGGWAGEVPEGGWAMYAEGDPDAPKLATLVSCRWCISVYVAVGVVAARRLAPRLWCPVAEALALSSVGTLLARLEDDG